MKIGSKIVDSLLLTRHCSSSNANLLRSFIKDKIRASGPITVHEYMQMVAGSQVGYYSQRPRRVVILAAVSSAKFRKPSSALKAIS